jgi:lysophospholipase L1-like esterase
MYALADSDGWGHTILSRFVAFSALDTVFRGCSGYNTAQAFVFLRDRVIPQDLSDAATVDRSHVVLWFGANDAADRDSNPLQHVSLPCFRKNVSAMIQLLNAAGVPVPRITVVTPPPLIDSMWKVSAEAVAVPASGKPGFQDRFDAVTAQYAATALLVAAEHGAHGIDMRAVFFGQAEPIDQFFRDGLHLSSKGQSVVANELCLHISEVVRADPAVTGMFPYWATFEMTHEMKALQC